MTQTPTKPNANASQPKRKNTSKLWMILAVLLIIVVAALIFWFFSMKGNYESMVNEKEAQRVELQRELTELMVAHDSIKVQYGALSDSLILKDSIIQANAREIEQLLNYKWEYRKVNKKLELLRNITQGYVHQLDSLYTVNRELTEENEKIRQQYAREQDRTRELTKDKEELIEKVNLAAALKAYNVTAYGVRFTGSGRERETDKANKIERVKVCFTLGENSLVEPGIKTIYIRIIRPDGVVVTQRLESGNTFEFQGQQIEYSSKKEVEYKNKETYVCIFWTKKSDAEPAMEGVYNVTVFAEDYEIGKSSFELK
ncbi:MAG: hypothetical protein JW731_11060 [Bacteroidales bacterium]|nr:hypothetical protein [Bacteroidales bacterium]